MDKGPPNWCARLRKSGQAAEDTGESHRQMEQRGRCVDFVVRLVQRPVPKVRLHREREALCKQLSQVQGGADSEAATARVLHTYMHLYIRKFLRALLVVNKHTYTHTHTHTHTQSHALIHNK
jgi:hypothetical protein